MTRGCWALIAVNARVDCKSRLAGKLTGDMRLSLVRAMMERALAALRGSRTVTNVVVVTPERDTIPAEVRVIHDPGGGLNSALDAARQVLVGEGASELLVLHADLPLVTAGEIDQLVESGRRTGFAMATDADGTGTNALYVAPPASFRFRFGPGSRFRHLEEAARLGLEARLLRLHGLEFDLDAPADLDRLLELQDARYDFLSVPATNQTAATHEPIQPAGEARTRR